MDTKENKTPSIKQEDVAYWRTKPENTELNPGTPTDLSNNNGVPEKNHSKPTVVEKGPTLPKISEGDMKKSRKAIKDSYKEVFDKDFNE